MKTEVAVLAGGCFWGMEDLLRKLPGVIDTDVGYCGDDADTARYEIVKTGVTKHAEAVKIIFDPAIISFKSLLLEFFSIHDPTTDNQQGNDLGSQYRSTIFCQSTEQKEIARQVIDQVNYNGFWKAPVTTTLEEAMPFYRAEEYHQDYLVKNPTGYTCHWQRDVIF